MAGIAKLTRRSGWAAHIAPVTAAGVVTAADAEAFGRVKNTIRFGRSRSVETIEDFDTADNEMGDQLSGALTGTMNWDTNLVLDDAAFLLAEEAIESGEQVAIQIDAKSVDGLTTKSWAYVGIMSDLEVRGQQNGVGDTSITFTPGKKVASFVPAGT